MKITNLPTAAVYLSKCITAGTFIVSACLSAQSGQDTLKEKNIEEVIVVGYGTQKRSKVSSAVTEVSLDKITSRSLSGVGAALQGKAAGVTVLNEGGDPTGTPRVNIRGLGGINGETPLYVVDGVTYQSAPAVNPNDIESISVLKDASAAIYGARASGGVILISTKKGSKGTLTGEFDAKYGVLNAWKIRHSLNGAEFQDVMAQAYANAGKLDKLPDAFNAAKFPDGRITRTDWTDEIFRTGNVQEYNIDLRGGGEKSRFFTGMNYRALEGTLLNTQSKRYAFRVNSDYTLREWLKIGENLSYNYSDGNSADTNSGYTGAILAAMYYPSNVSVYDAAGNYSGLPISVAGGYGDMINPVAYLKRITYRNPTHNILINPYAEVKIFDGLKFKSNFGQTFRLATSKDFTKRVLEVGKIFDFNRLVYQNNNYSKSLAEQILSFNRTFNRHTIDVTAAYTFEKETAEGFMAKGQDFKSEADFYQYLSNANSDKDVDSWKSFQALSSWLGRLNYDFDSRYMISLLGRRDGSSLVAEQNRYANYYSVSGAWAVSREAFLREVNWLSNFKLRASHGVLGNLGGVDPNAVNPLMTRENNVIFGQNPSQNVGYYATVYPNPNLKWGKSQQTDYGLDLGFFQNRLTIQADYFVKDSKDQIFRQPLPSTSGYKYTYINAGLFRDKGFEVGLSFTAPRQAEFQYGINANFSHLSNTVVEMPVSQIALDNNVRGVLLPTRVMVGDPLYSYYGYKTAGLFQTQEEVNNYKDSAGKLIQPDAKPGDIKFLKKPGRDGVLDKDDMVFLGSPYPKLNYSFSLNAEYKGFDLNVFFQGVQGNKLFNGLKFITLNPGGTGQNYNMDRDILNAWTPTNTNTNIPRLEVGDPRKNYSRVSDFYVEEGSYLRLKNLTVGYTLPQSFADAVNVRKVRAYITADNLVTFTKYTGFDPEVGMDAYGIDQGRYPQARTIIFGVTLGL